MQCNFLLVGEEKSGQQKTFIHRPVKSSTHRIHWMQVPVGYRITSTVCQIASQVTGKGDKIDKLQILGHGDAGTMFVGQDITEDTVWPFGWLRDLFVDMAFGIQLLGCGVASDQTILIGNNKYRLGTFSPHAGGRGYRLMRKLAEATQQTVTAGIHVQVNDAFFDIEGAAIRVYPDGTWDHFIGGSLE